MLKHTRLVLAALGLMAVMVFTCGIPRAISDEIQELERQRQEIVLNSMDFSGNKEKEAFLQVYVPYQQRLIKQDEERAVLIEAYAQSQKVAALKTQTARELLQHALQGDRKRVELVAGYIAQLEKILPIQKVVRAYQIENRIQALMLVNAAKNIPLAK
ncbi:MAG: hypothetical protein ACLQU2_24485 [Candidatus Binataceae bacterium]